MVAHARVGYVYSKPWRKAVKMGDETLYASVGSYSEWYRAHRYETREPGTIEWITSYVKKGDVFFDVGANTGLYAIYAGKLGARAYGFEPEAENFASFNRNIRLNKSSLSVAALPTAISERAAVTALVLNGLAVPGAALHRIDAQAANEQIVNVEAALALGLDILCTFFGLEEPTHIKIDVDGYEVSVLEGLNIEKRTELRSVMIEVSQINQDHVMRVMTDARYTLEARESVGDQEVNELYVRGA